jgi:aspartate carbamoyltransferase regulatory subunit
MAVNTRSIESEPIMQMAMVVPIEDNFRCDDFRSVFSTISQVRDHFIRVHAGIISKFKCRICEKVFPGLRGIQCHVSK